MWPREDRAGLRILKEGATVSLISLASVSHHQVTQPMQQSGSCHLLKDLKVLQMLDKCDVFEEMFQLRQILPNAQAAVGLRARVLDGRASLPGMVAGTQCMRSLQGPSPHTTLRTESISCLRKCMLYLCVG